MGVMNLLGIFVYIIYTTLFITSLIWILFTGKMISKRGIVKFLIASIIWNGVLFVVSILIYYIAGMLPSLYYSVYSEFWNRICGVILLAYHIMQRIIFPIYTLILIVYCISYHTKRRLRARNK